MREMKQTATFAASLPVIALTAACWGYFCGCLVGVPPLGELRSSYAEGRKLRPATHANLRSAQGALRNALHSGLGPRQM
jgi:hypothetical protein